MYTTMTALVVAQHRAELLAWAARERQLRQLRQLRRPRAAETAPRGRRTATSPRVRCDAPAVRGWRAIGHH